jgi:hypothetical protein
MSTGRLSRREFLRQGATLAAAGATASLWLPVAGRRQAWARTRDLVAFPAGTTYERSIVPLAANGYRLLEFAEGWPLVVRDDLDARARPNRENRRVALASILQLTDVQIPDSQSTARGEWLGRFDAFRAAWRPHETVMNHVSEAAVRGSTVVGRGPVTGRHYDAAVNTGDNIDNMQANELRWFLTLMNGGELTPNSGDAGYTGVQEYWTHEGLAEQFPPDGYDPFYWRPDEPPAGFEQDRFKTDHGYPTLNGFLDAAVQPFAAVGLGIPWYSMYGNHDGLFQGNAPATPPFQAFATGQIPDFPPGVGAKVVGFPPEVPWTNEGAEAFFQGLVTGAIPPEALLAGPFLPVPADTDRRLIGPFEYVQTHLTWPTGTPDGHGFTEDNLGDGSTAPSSGAAPGLLYSQADDNTTLYYTFRPVLDAPVLGIGLDTTNRLGGPAGSIGAQQFAWLEARLREVHSRWYDAGGRLQRGRADDHFVILFGHHNLETMGNLDPSPDDPARIPTAQLRDLLHRFPNVIAFVNGHSHINRVWARPDLSGRSQGFWEISTSAQLDYPMQTRVIEIVDNRDRTVSIFCSLIDQAGPANARAVFGDPGPTYELPELAAYGRELAYNDSRDHELSGDPFDHRAGTPLDRNVELLLSAPFPLSTAGPPERVRATTP